RRIRPFGILPSSATVPKPAIGEGRRPQSRSRRRFSILSRPMAAGRSTLKVAPRADFGSRTSPPPRRDGLVPGVVYGGGSEARPFQVAERDVRVVLAEGAALFDLQIEGSKAVPVVIKEQQRHPTRGSLQHIDLQEVKLDEAIQADVAIEL